RALLAVVALIHLHPRRLGDDAVHLTMRMNKSYVITILSYHLLVDAQSFPLEEAPLAHVAVELEAGVVAAECLISSCPSAVIMWSDNRRLLSKRALHRGHSS
ncbi:hypothetical protein PFISCL1PPCAC_8432, partial [Pristionchus fissidentatus]